MRYFTSIHQNLRRGCTSERGHHRAVWMILSRSFTTLVLAVAISATCQTSRMPSDLVEVYELITVDGNNLPLRIVENRDGYQELVSSTLSLRHNATADLVTRLRNKLPNGVFPQTDSVTGPYTVTERAIHVTPADLPAVLLIRDSIGLTLSADSHVYFFKRKI
jgi:hypothetical protein